jgi:hypothetical protein
VRALDQDDAEGAPGAEPYDQFGFSLAAGDLDGDGHDDLAVGAPFEPSTTSRRPGRSASSPGRSAGWAATTRTR